MTFYAERKKELTAKINKALAERDKIAKAKAPIAQTVRDLTLKSRYDKTVQADLDAARAEQFVFQGEVRRVRSELQKLKKQWIENETNLNIEGQREDNRSQPSATRMEDY